MKLENLMIGDWVSLFQGKPDGSSCNVQVTFVGEYGEVGIEGCEEYTSANCNLLFPIPLTVEILEKNGFMKHNDQVCNDIYEFLSEDSGGLIYLYLYGVYFFLFDNINMQIEYVHQLQHALRLCGIEKEIKI